MAEEKRNEIVFSVSWEDLGEEAANKTAQKMIREITDEFCYEEYEEAKNFCYFLDEKDLLTAKTCKAMASKCEKFKEYADAIEWYEKAMEFDEELDFYGKIERLYKKL